MASSSTAGKRPTEHQLREHDVLRRSGIHVHVVDGTEAIARMMEEEQEQMDSWFVPPETEKEIGRSIGHYASENGCFRISFKNALKIDGVFNDIRKNLLF